VEPAAQKSAPEDKSIETAPTDQSSGTSLLRKDRRLEDFFAPRPGIEWQVGLGTRPSAQTLAELAAFREIALRWQAAAALPIDQLVLTVAPDLFRQPPDLALAYKLAITLRRIADAHPGWRLEDLGTELGAITRNARGVLGFAAEDVGTAAQQQRGKVVVTTLHKAKGLEWDRVYMMSVSSYDFPSGDEDDTYFSEKWFVRGRLNLEAEALDQLAAIRSQDKVAMYQEGDGSRRARLEYIRERLRLIYVGITRAREELIVTWNSGRSGDVKASRALQELRRWWTAAADSALPD
jgi:DNA helicase-2/ATP-dependent DNA helicase PcrA